MVNNMNGKYSPRNIKIVKTTNSPGNLLNKTCCQGQMTNAFPKYQDKYINNLTVVTNDKLKG